MIYVNDFDLFFLCTERTKTSILNQDDEIINANGKKMFCIDNGEDVILLDCDNLKIKTENDDLIELGNRKYCGDLEFNYDNIAGTVVGLYCPDYMSGLNAAGWHLHFISSDKTKGGHVLDVDINSAKLSIDPTQGYNMQLPETEMFPTLDLTKDQSEDIKKVETKD